MYELIQNDVGGNRVYESFFTGNGISTSTHTHAHLEIKLNFHSNC